MNSEHFQYLNNLLDNELDYNQYLELYKYSIDNTEQFWSHCAKKYLSWFEDFTKVYTGELDSMKHLLPANNDRYNSLLEQNQWFTGGKVNACYNCLDRHLEQSGHKIAYYWQGDEPNHTMSVTYRELYQEVCKFSNVLKKLGLKQKDRVCIYLPMSIEAIAAMLACARIGVVHTVVFAGFSGTALAERIVDAKCSVLITTDNTKRGGKTVAITDYVKDCIEQIHNNPDNNLSNILYIQNYYSSKTFDLNQYIKDDRNLTNNIINISDYNNLSQTVSENCEPVWLDSESPLFILYTSGSTGKPKGVLHTTAGYLLHTVFSFKKLFNINSDKYSDEVYWCTADIGWVAGHSYVVYGALGNGVTSVLFSGTPNYPDYSIFWQLVDKYKVSIFYTAPTAIRALMKEGQQYLKSSSRTSLRLLATVGEPINPEAWMWYYTYVGNSRCPIVDTWWQTETGAAMLAPLANSDIIKPGCAMLPFYGVELAILDDKKHVNSKNNIQGSLVITKPWPGMMRTVYMNHKKYIDTYLKPFPGYFYTGDISKRDADGHYWIFGRGDDVLNIAGHRFGTAEIESALVEHEAVAEAAVVPVPDDVKGQVLLAFVTLINTDINANNTNTDAEKSLKQELHNQVRTSIGPVVIIKKIVFVNNLPKTRSGKIMRRILKQIALGNITDLGDVSTLINPESVVEIADAVLCSV